MILSALNRKSTEKLTPAEWLFGKPPQLPRAPRKRLPVAPAHHAVKKPALTINFNQLPSSSSHWLTCWVLVGITREVCANHQQKASFIVHLSIRNRGTPFTHGDVYWIDNFHALHSLCVGFGALCIRAYQQRGVKRSIQFHGRTFSTSNVTNKTILIRKTKASTVTLPPTYSAHKHLLASRILVPTHSWEKWDE